MKNFKIFLLAAIILFAATLAILEVDRQVAHVRRGRHHKRYFTKILREKYRIRRILILHI